MLRNLGQMEVDSGTNTVKEEHLQGEETDDSCTLEYFEIVPLTRDTDGSCTTECVDGDWSAEVKQENLTVVKQELDDVGRVMSYSVYHCRNSSFVFLETTFNAISVVVYLLSVVR